jgi:hypothetical protein
VCSPCRYETATSGAQGIHDRQLAVVNGAKGNDPDLAVFTAFVGTLQNGPSKIRMASPKSIPCLAILAAFFALSHPNAI